MHNYQDVSDHFGMSIDRFSPSVLCNRYMTKIFHDHQPGSGEMGEMGEIC